MSILLSSSVAGEIRENQVASSHDAGHFSKRSKSWDVSPGVRNRETDCVRAAFRKSLGGSTRNLQLSRCEGCFLQRWAHSRTCKHNASEPGRACYFLRGQLPVVGPLFSQAYKSLSP